jgi:hypothetical protein
MLSGKVSIVCGWTGREADHGKVILGTLRHITRDDVSTLADAPTLPG